MSVRRVPRPLGVILFVYEARPTVTIEGALLTVCTGNAVLLRGGSEMSATSQAFGALLRDCLAAAGLPSSMAIVLDDPDRKQLRTLLACRDDIDLLIPRGSPSLIGYCRDTSAIPMVASGGGSITCTFTPPPIPGRRWRSPWTANSVSRPRATRWR